MYKMKKPAWRESCSGLDRTDCCAKTVIWVKPGRVLFYGEDWWFSLYCPRAALPWETLDRYRALPVNKETADKSSDKQRLAEHLRTERRTRPPRRSTLSSKTGDRKANQCSSVWVGQKCCGIILPPNKSSFVKIKSFGGGACRTGHFWLVDNI